MPLHLLSGKGTWPAEHPTESRACGAQQDSKAPTAHNQQEVNQSLHQHSTGYAQDELAVTVQLSLAL
jgi:hypothetical protein